MAVSALYMLVAYGLILDVRARCVLLGPAGQVELIEESTWYHRAFLEWTVPWWTAPILYTIIAIGWALCIYTTLLYGVKFSDDQVRSVWSTDRKKDLQVITAECVFVGLGADRMR